MSFKSPALGESAKDPTLLTQVLQQALDQMEAEARKADPVGRVALWPDGVPLPEGWLEADGETYNQTRYPELYQMGGGTWTEPSATTFEVPDLGADAPSGWVYMIRAE